MSLLSIRTRSLRPVYAAALFVLCLIGSSLAFMNVAPSANASISTGDIVYESNSDIWVRHSNGTTVQMTKDGIYGGYSTSPDVSPDGSKIAYLAPDPNPNLNQMITWVMDADGSAAYPVDPQSPSNQFADSAPRWSPDGAHIAVSRNYNWGQGYNGNGYHDLVIINIANGTYTTVTTDHMSMNPAWSHDGTRLAYVTLPNNDMNIISTNGTGQHTVSTSSNNLGTENPEWSADGNRIYFDTGAYGLRYFESTNGFSAASSTDPVNLSTGFDDESPRLSASGSSLIFFSVDRCGSNCSGYGIYTVPNAGGSPTLVSTTTTGQIPNLVKNSWPNSTTKTLVGLGDSIAAGEGILYGFKWENNSWVQDGTNTPNWMDTSSSLDNNYKVCHQSGSGYPSRFFSNGDNYNVYNMACTGASASSGMLNPQYGKTDPDNSSASPVDVTAQLKTAAGNMLDQHNPDIISLTLGADDIDFSGWVHTCYSPDVDCNTPDNSTEISNELASQKSGLRSVLTSIDAHAVALNKIVKVFVTNYYDPFPSSSSSSCIDTQAGILNGTFPHIGIDQNELDWLNNQLITMNSNINSEVTYAQTNDSNLDVHIVDISSTFAGHEFCTSNPWAYGPSIDYPISGAGPTNSPAPFHPTPDGQQAIYQAVKAAVNGS